MKIHPSAIVSSEAILESDVEIGPFCLVDSDVLLGSGCRLSSNVTVRSGTIVGSNCTIYEGTVLGGLPQHLNPPENLGGVTIGSGCTIREHVTVHRSTRAGTNTSIGDHCLLMVGAHVAHDCHVGNNVILTNGAMLGGHVEVGDRACLGGNSAVHQFCRVGRLAMVGGCTKVVQDVPPFVLTDGATALIVGLNRVGLRRADLSREDILDLKAAYRLIYREGHTFHETLAELRRRFPTGVASEFAEFFTGGQRGFVQERRSPPRVALRVHPAVDEIDESSSPKEFRHEAA